MSDCHADRYVRRIRNAEKKRYAVAFLAWVRSGERGPEPDKGTLSYMGAQSVRIALRVELRREEERAA